MSERDSDKKPEAKTEHTHRFTPRSAAAFLPVCSYLSCHSYVVLFFSSSLLFSSSHRSHVCRFSWADGLCGRVRARSGSEWVSEREWVSWMTEQMSRTRPIRTCCSWEPSQQRPPSWSPSWSSSSASAAKGKRSGHVTDEQSRGRTEILKQPEVCHLCCQRSVPSRITLIIHSSFYVSLLLLNSSPPFLLLPSPVLSVTFIPRLEWSGSNEC